MRKTRSHGVRKSKTALLPPRGSDMKSETKKRLRGLSSIEKEKRLDELNRKLAVAQRIESKESLQEDADERAWLKKKLGYKQ